jgi:hypothetical protein
MARCLSVVVKVLLVGAALLSVGWALSETRPPRAMKIEPRQVEPAVELPVAAPVFHPPPRLPPPIVPAPAVKRPSIAHISGRIVDELGNPRTDAKADLDLGDVCMWIHVDSTGHFEADLAPGDYTITAVDDSNGEATSDPLSLKPGEEVRELVLELRNPPPREPPEDVNHYDD